MGVSNKVLVHREILFSKAKADLNNNKALCKCLFVLQIMKRGTLNILTGLALSHQKVHLLWSLSLITYGGSSSKVIGVIIGMGTEERKVAMTILRLLSM